MFGVYSATYQGRCLWLIEGNMGVLAHIVKSLYICFLSLQTSTTKQEAICSRLANARSQTLTGTERRLFYRL